MNDCGRPRSGYAGRGPGNGHRGEHAQPTLAMSIWLESSYVDYGREPHPSRGRARVNLHSDAHRPEDLQRRTGDAFAIQEKFNLAAMDPADVGRGAQ